MADACHGRKGQLRSGDVWWFPLFFSDFGIPRDSMRQVGDFNPSQEYEKSISPIESRGIPKSKKKTKVETMSPIYYFLDLVLYYLSILHTP